MKKINNDMFVLPEEIDTINFSVIITYRNGNTTRGYTVQATNQNEAFTKLMNHINFDLVQRVEIAEIIMEEDMIK